MNNYINEIKEILLKARQMAYSTINSQMVEAYWLIGKRIVEQEQHGEERAAYGENILKQLSKELTAEFGKGFSYSNLRNFRQFYLTYRDEKICYTLCSKSSWSHNRLIMRVESEEARLFYLNESTKEGWSVRALERNINTFYYQRLLSSGQRRKLSDDLAMDVEKPEDFIKDPYIFEFLNIEQSLKTTEREIESALIENLQQFLLELGKGFSFIGRQFRISTEKK